jgi:hypothetical protein
MIPFTLTDNETHVTQSYSLPTCWEDVSWDQYQTYVEIMNQEFHTSQDKLLTQLATLCNMDIQTAQDLGWEFASQLLKHLTFLETKPQSTELAHVTIGGETFYRQPLTTFGEIMAYDKVWSNPTQSIEEKIPYILALGLRRTVVKPVYEPVKSWWKRKIMREPAALVDKITYEPLDLEEDWIESRAKLFTYGLNVSQVMNLSAFFLSSGERLQSVSRSFSSLPRVTRAQTQSFAAASAAITAGKWRSGIFAPILRMSIGCYLYLLTKYFNVSNISDLSQMTSVSGITSKSV